MAIDDDITFLERVPTLSLLGRQALRILAIGAETRYIHSGEVLFKRGDEADGDALRAHRIDDTQHVVRAQDEVVDPQGADGAGQVRGRLGIHLHTGCVGVQDKPSRL